MQLVVLQYTTYIDMHSQRNMSMHSDHKVHASQALGVMFVTMYMYYVQWAARAHTSDPNGLTT
jgi:hypothetical protein